MESAFQRPGPLRLESTNLEAEWTSFLQKFEIFLLASGAEGKSSETRLAMLLNFAGDEALKLYNTFTYESPGDNKKIEIVLNQFNSYCLPRKNTVFERFNFWLLTQQPGESVDAFAREAPPDQPPPSCSRQPTSKQQAPEVLVKRDEPTDCPEVLVKRDEPTDWVNRLLLVERKEGALHSCLDPRDMKEREDHRVLERARKHNTIVNEKGTTREAPPDQPPPSTREAPPDQPPPSDAPLPSLSRTGDALHKERKPPDPPPSDTPLPSLPRTGNALHKERKPPDPPIADSSHSPAQLLMSRVLRTKLPVSADVLQPTVEDGRPQLQARQDRHWVNIRRRTGSPPNKERKTGESPCAICRPVLTHGRLIRPFLPDLAPETRCTRNGRLQSVDQTSTDCSDSTMTNEVALF